jgi:hypothetical protein
LLYGLCCDSWSQDQKLHGWRRTPVRAKEKPRKFCAGLDIISQATLIWRVAAQVKEMLPVQYFSPVVLF